MEGQAKNTLPDLCWRGNRELELNPTERIDGGGQEQLVATELGHFAHGGETHRRGVTQA
jgi:hypothetical protein